jgi:hypothetical protein
MEAPGGFGMGQTLGYGSTWAQGIFLPTFTFYNLSMDAQNRNSTSFAIFRVTHIIDKRSRLDV